MEQEAVNIVERLRDDFKLSRIIVEFTAETMYTEEIRYFWRISAIQGERHITSKASTLSNAYHLMLVQVAQSEDIPAEAVVPKMIAASPSTQEDDEVPY